MIITKKKLLSTTLIVCFLLSALPAFAAEGNGFSGGNGTVDAPYLIATAEDLSRLSQTTTDENDYAGVYFLMANDISLARYQPWMPIAVHNASSIQSFAGNFDGGGHCISDMVFASEQNMGLFGRLSENGRVSNLKIDGYRIAEESVFGYGLGGVASYNGGTIFNCGNVGDVPHGNGIVGSNAGMVISCYNNGAIYNGSGIAGSNHAQIIGCSNTGSVVDSAGIVGENNGVIVDCVNSGNVTGTTEDVFVGGIVQWNEQIPAYNSLNGGIVTGCINTGEISAMGGWDMSFGHSGPGGIAGRNGGLIDNCRNEGTIRAVGFMTAAGGIAVSNGDGSYSMNAPQARIQNCTNIGPISADNASERPVIGGLVGQNGAWGEIWNSVNSGMVSALPNISPEYSYYFGGVVGFNGGIIGNCLNSGEVDAYRSYAIGGITGETEAGVVTNCYSLGKVHGGSEHTGGITGYLHCKLVDSLTQNCGWKSGVAQRAIGAKQDDSTVRNCVAFSDETKATFTVKDKKFIGLLDALNAYADMSAGLLAWEQTGDSPFLSAADFTKRARAETPFADIPSDGINAAAVAYVYKNGIMNGASVTQFSPDSTVTRATVATMLYRLAGKPVVGKSDPPADVKNDGWYTDAVLWTIQTGIMTGYSSNLFGPDDPVTYEQLAAILERYTRQFSLLLRGDCPVADTFPEPAASSYWSSASVDWMIAYGLTRDLIAFAPKAEVSRGKVAVILARFFDGLYLGTNAGDDLPIPVDRTQ